MDIKLIAPILTAALIIWLIYRRLRRTFGRQAYQQRRLVLRAGILCVVGTLMLASALHSTELLASLLGGAILGWLLALVGLRHTVFESTPQGRYYTPHTYIGLLVSGLFLGRLAYRFLSVYLGTQSGSHPNSSPFSTYQQSPLTLALFGLLIGYYVAYNFGIVRKLRNPTL